MDIIPLIVFVVAGFILAARYGAFDFGEGD